MCGGGTQLRNLECRNGGGQGLRVIDGNCYSGAQPVTSQNCNTDACLPLFWSPGPWSACSVQCGGGTSVRTVGCTAYSAGSTTLVANNYCQVLGPMPPTSQTCNLSPCAETTYKLNIFDSRVLSSGAQRSDHYAPGELHFYTFQRPNAGAEGVCLVATPSNALSPSCTVEAERAVASCFNSLQGCIASANAAEVLAASSAGLPAPPARTPIDLWNYFDPAYATANGTCQCFQTAATCIAKNVCSSDIAASQQQLADVCGLSAACPATGACAIPPAPASTTSASAATRAQISLFVSKFNGASLGSNTFSPPTTPATSNWASAGFAPGEQRLVIWSTDDGYDADTNTILIGVQSVASDVNIAVSATALSAFPVSYSGTLTTSGVSAAAIRAGGLTLAVSLSCDAFVDPEPA